MAVIALSVVLRDLQTVCVSVCFPAIKFGIPEPVISKLVCLSWRLSPSQRRTSQIPPITLRMFICVWAIVARQLLRKNVTTEYTLNNR